MAPILKQIGSIKRPAHHASTPNAYVGASTPRVLHRPSAGLPFVGKHTQERLLPLISQYLAAEARTARFEVVAGRTAMIGIATAALLELTTTANGVFVNIGLKNTPLLCVVLMATAAALAGATRQGSGAQPLLEPVLASLTSKARSLSSVSFQASEGAKDIDVYVDRIFKEVFSSRFIKATFPSEEEDIFM